MLLHDGKDETMKGASIMEREQTKGPKKYKDIVNWKKKSIIIINILLTATNIVLNINKKYFIYFFQLIKFIF